MPIHSNSPGSRLALGAVFVCACDLFRRIPTSFDAFNTFRHFSVRMAPEGCGNNMIAEGIDVPARLHEVLRPLGITRSMKAHRILCGCVERIAAQEDRLEAVQKELYEPLAEQYDCEWKAIQSMVRRAAKTAWAVNPERVQQLAGYPLTGCPSAVQFLEMLYNAVVRGE